jgi:hypothetical protein
VPNLPRPATPIAPTHRTPLEVCDPSTLGIHRLTTVCHVSIQQRCGVALRCVAAHVRVHGVVWPRPSISLDPVVTIESALAGPKHSIQGADTGRTRPHDPTRTHTRTPGSV